GSHGERRPATPAVGGSAPGPRTGTAGGGSGVPVERRSPVPLSGEVRRSPAGGGRGGRSASVSGRAPARPGGIVQRGEPPHPPGDRPGPALCPAGRPPDASRGDVHLSGPLPGSPHLPARPVSGHGRKAAGGRSL